MEHVIPYCHRLLTDHTKPNSTCVDFTCGTGKDTLFLSELCPQGQVHGFDIQKQAIETTDKLLHEHNKTNVKLHLDNHENFKTYLNAYDIGVFNLGYLPGSDLNIATETQTTLNTVKLALAHLSSKGLLVIVCYINHPGGAQEASAVTEYVEQLSDSFATVTKYSFLNKKTAPFVLAIEKR